MPKAKSGERVHIFTPATTPSSCCIPPGDAPYSLATSKTRAQGVRRMEWKTPLAYITRSVDQELLLCNEYLVTENCSLRKQMRRKSCTRDQSPAPASAGRISHYLPPDMRRKPPLYWPKIQCSARRLGDILRRKRRRAGARVGGLVPCAALSAHVDRMPPWRTAASASTSPCPDRCPACKY
jgi:hypothetical protein